MIVLLHKYYISNIYQLHILEEFSILFVKMLHGYIEMETSLKIKEVYTLRFQSKEACITLKNTYLCFLDECNARL